MILPAYSVALTHSFIRDRSTHHKADEDVDVLHLIDDAAIGSRIARCGSRTRCSSLCRWATLVQGLNGHVCVFGEEAEEAAGEANRERYRALGKPAQPARHQVVRRSCAIAWNDRARDVGGYTYAESGRTPATIFFLSLPPCFPGFAERRGEARNDLEGSF